MHERMGRARRMIWYCWLLVAFCSARSWMSFSCSVRGRVSGASALEGPVPQCAPT